ncbi:MAG: DUF2284 domain-containing protein [Blautia sp.]|nr:DUF2284 domain-containing protein [Blautia sp.]
MLDMEKLGRMGTECGFTHVAPLDVSTITLLQDVRDMCAANTCGQYGKNWCCPPGVGEIPELEERVRKYKKGILVQTVGELEDSMDWEGMMEAEQQHKKSFNKMHRLLEEEYPDLLAIGSGTCTRCKECTYPDQPCRFPNNTFGSMEAYGMLVSEVCKKNDLAYNYGPKTTSYTACFLID